MLHHMTPRFTEKKVVVDYSAQSKKKKVLDTLEDKLKILERQIADLEKKKAQLEAEIANYKEQAEKNLAEELEKRRQEFETQLQQKREEVLKQAREEGIRQGLDEVRVELEEVKNQVQYFMEELKNQQRAEVARMEREMFEILKRVVEVICLHTPENLDTVQKVLEENFENLIDQPWVRIIISNDELEKSEVLKVATELLKGVDSLEVKVQRMPPGVVVETQYGFVDASFKLRAEKLFALIEQKLRERKDDSFE